VVWMVSRSRNDDRQKKKKTGPEGQDKKKRGDTSIVGMPKTPKDKHHPDRYRQVQKKKKKKKQTRNRGEEEDTLGCPYLGPHAKKNK